MRKTWEKRLHKLESILQSRVRPAAIFRYGRVRYLSGQLAGARHMVTAKSGPTALPHVEQCEFEERVGPQLGARDDLSFHVYLSLEDESAIPS